MHIGKQLSLTHQFQHRDPIWQMMSKQNLSATIKPKPQFVKLHAALENAEVGAIFRKYKCRKEQRNTCENIPLYAHHQLSSLRNFVGISDFQVFHFKAVKMEGIASSSSLRSLSWT